MTIQGNTLIEIASNFVGVKEDGNNKGKWIEEFQRALDGKASGEPWCACFVAYVVQKTSQLLQLDPKIHLSESCMEMWNKSPVSQRILVPEVGCLVIWNDWGSNRGHVGFCKEIQTPEVVSTIEGNTGPQSTIVRDGDGVYEKMRHVTVPKKPLVGQRVVVGFLRVF